MFPYWLLFGSFALAALTQHYRPINDPRIGPVLAFLAISMALMIGLRFHVGADFETYRLIFERAASSNLAEALEHGDPGYEFINWSVGRFGGGVWHVNCISAIIFVWGLVRLCQREPVPALAILVAIPYLVIVVAMGYTRQAVAIGFIMGGIASIFRNGSVLRFAAYVALAGLFHRTAIIVLPLAIFAGKRNYFLNAVALLAIGYGLYSALLEESVDTLIENYIDARYNSQGAAIRVAMNVVPAVIILVRGRRMYFTEYELRLWKMFGIVSLMMIPLLFLVPSTTAIDRIALYMLPIQIVAIGRSIFLFSSPLVGRTAVVGYCFAVLFVWLNFAAHAFAWVPYRLTPIWN